MYCILILDKLSYKPYFILLIESVLYAKNNNVVISLQKEKIIIIRGDLI